MLRVAQSFRRRAKNRINVVGIPGCDVQESLFARGLVARDGSLEHVARAVKLVTVTKVGPALAGLLDREVAVEVAIGLLRPGEQADDFVELRLQRWIGVRGERVGSGFERLVEVRVNEDWPAEAVGRAAGGKKPKG